MSSKRYYLENRELVKARSREYYHAHKHDPEFRRSRSMMARRYVLRTQYGLTFADLAQMRRQQRGRCALCQRRVALVVDHDHKTGKVRGLLCRFCNQVLGMVEFWNLGRKMARYAGW